MHPAVQGDQIAGCDPPLARADILLALVGLHGPTWRDASLADAEWLNFADPVEAAQARSRSFFQWRHFRNSSTGTVSELSAEQTRTCSSAWPTRRASPSARRLGDVFCAIHQDYRLDNLLLDTTRAPAALTVVDWQSLAIGHPLSDVSYFLGGNLKVSDRRATEERMVRDYHDALRETGVADLGWSECWEAYRRASLFGLATVVFASMGVARTERGDELIATMARRHATHALDLGTEEFLD